MFLHRYRGGLSQDESEVLRSLRRRGFALVVFPPTEVGDALNRKPVEDRMVKAGKDALKSIRRART